MFPIPSSCRPGLAVAPLCLALVACDVGSNPVPADADDGNVLSAREAARQDVQRMLRDVQLDTLTKRVTALEVEIEQLKSQQEGASALELERRLSQLETSRVAAPLAGVALPVVKAPAKTGASTKVEAPAKGTAAVAKGSAAKPKAPPQAAPGSATNPARTTSKESTPRQADGN